MRYLIRCGAIKEEVKNLPKEFLRLIEPQYCGLCQKTMESFTSSRIHYLSKNHARNQKRWLIQGDYIGDTELQECDFETMDYSYPVASYAG